jgi:hypothetical protein
MLANYLVFLSDLKGYYHHFVYPSFICKIFFFKTAEPISAGMVHGKKRFRYVQMRMILLGKGLLCSLKGEFNLSGQSSVNQKFNISLHCGK